MTHNQAIEVGRSRGRIVDLQNNNSSHPTKSSLAGQDKRTSSAASQPGIPLKITDSPQDLNYIDEISYCIVYPDVAAAVASKIFGSAEEHYRQIGYSEILEGDRVSPCLLNAPPNIALPVIVGLLGQATLANCRPWEFLSRDEQTLVDCFAEIVFEKAYVTHFDDLKAAILSGSIASGFNHWLQHGRSEINNKQRDIQNARKPPLFVASAEMSANMRDLVSAVTDWRHLLYNLARGSVYQIVEAQQSTEVPIISATHVRAQVRVAQNSLAVHSDQWSGSEHLYGCTPRIIAFYLPQFHAIEENDTWWGTGFTEWTNVRKAKPNFEGHWQPHVPLTGEYYDLSDMKIQRQQAGLAKEYGISAFCYYMYWFNGRRLLERPLDQMISNKDIDMDFCICWANENWTRTWDGKAEDVLLSQCHTPESDRRFIIDALDYLADDRYLRVGGKLLLLVYRVDLLPDCRATANIWREEVRRAGLGELHLCAVQFYGVTDPEPWGFDAAVEFPPHGWLCQQNLPDIVPAIQNPNFRGQVFDYRKAVDWALSKPYADFTWYRTAFPSWDNTARRQDTSHIFAFSNPLAFEDWLTAILRQTIIMAPSEHQLVFVNAWNEWGEGAHLEPDERNGMLNLMALNSALNAAKQETWPLGVLARLRRSGDYSGRSRDEAALLNFLRASENAFGVLTNQLRAVGLNPFA